MLVKTIGDFFLEIFGLFWVTEDRVQGGRTQGVLLVIILFTGKHIGNSYADQCA